MFQKLAQYIQEIKIEMTKVTWPTREDLLGSTTVVIIVSLAFAVFIYLVDQIFNRGIGFILNLK